MGTEVEHQLLAGHQQPFREGHGADGTARHGPRQPAQRRWVTSPDVIRTRPVRRVHHEAPRVVHADRRPRTRRPSVVRGLDLAADRGAFPWIRRHDRLDERRRVRGVDGHERSQERRQQGGRVDVTQPGGQIHVRRRVEVHPDADDRMIDPLRREPRLREDASRLAIVDEQVVGPLASQLLRRDLASRAHHGEAGGERQHAGAIGRQPCRTKDDREQEGPPRNVDPRPVEPSASAGLMARGDQGPLGGAPHGQAPAPSGSWNR